MPKVGQRSALRSRLLRVFAGFDACDLPESAPAIGSQTFMRLPWSALDEGTATLVQRPKDLRAGDRCQRLVEVPLTLRLCRPLDLEQVHVMDLPAINPDHPLAEQWVIS